MGPCDGSSELDDVGREDLDNRASCIRAKSALGVHSGLQRTQEGRIVAAHGVTELTAAGCGLALAIQVEVDLPRYGNREVPRQFHHVRSNGPVSHEPVHLDNETTMIDALGRRHDVAKQVAHKQLGLTICRMSLADGARYSSFVEWLQSCHFVVKVGVFLQ
jgi:hypothetical protein